MPRFCSLYVHLRCLIYNYIHELVKALIIVGISVFMTGGKYQQKIGKIAIKHAQVGLQQ